MEAESWLREKVGGGGAFSNLKRAFGEFAAAHKFENMAKEMMLKAFCYNLMINWSAGS